MSKEKKWTYSQIFEPPEGYFGQVCVCCAMSADTVCVENILTTFSGGKKNNSRAFDRNASLFMMLNKGEPFLGYPNPIYGFCQLEPKTNGAWDKVYVQHAKVAVMQFGRKTTHESEKLRTEKDVIWRFVICTGNWTEASAKHQIEMVWNEDVFIERKKYQQISDLAAVANFLLNLRTLYNCSEKLWPRAQIMFDKIFQLEKKYRQSLPPTRFFSTLPELRNNKHDCSCMLNHIANQFSRYNGMGKKTYVIAGSGFFEEYNEKKEDKPEVFRQIEEKILQKLNTSIEKRLVLNPGYAGQIAAWKLERDWEMFSAVDYAGESRKLHAKYIFIGDCKLNNKKRSVDNGLLYLGSGNLSIKGLLSSFGNNYHKPGKGNIEAGIVVKTNDIFPKKEEDVLNCLLVGEKVSLEDLLAPSLENDEEPPCTEERVNPVLAIHYINENDFFIEWNLDCIIEGTKCKVKISENLVRTINVHSEKDKYQHWNDWGIASCPHVQWIEIDVDGKICIVPMITEDGLMLPYCRTIEDFDGLLESLNDFPKNVALFDDESEPPIDLVHRIKKRTSHSSKSDEKIGERKYLYGEAMKLIESIAAYNNEYFPTEKTSNQEMIYDWIFTINTLLDNLSPKIVKNYKDLNIDFISVLKNPEGFAPHLDARHKKKWDEFIDSWAKKWGLDSENKNLWIEA